MRIHTPLRKLAAIALSCSRTPPQSFSRCANRRSFFFCFSADCPSGDYSENISTAYFSRFHPPSARPLFSVPLLLLSVIHSSHIFRIHNHTPLLIHDGFALHAVSSKIHFRRSLINGFRRFTCVYSLSSLCNACYLFIPTSPFLSLITVFFLPLVRVDSFFLTCHHHCSLESITFHRKTLHLCNCSAHSLMSALPG